MQTFTDAEIQKNCPHCDPHSLALKRLLQETSRFWIVGDAYPITKGHILIIPKKHISCVGEYDKETYNEFTSLYEKTSLFLQQTYGSVSTFEHGKIGQTVFHAHTHLLPFVGSSHDIVPEGKDFLRRIDDLMQMQYEFKRSGMYLFFSIDQDKWLVDTNIGKPRFFRDRFAKALGRPERGNWKEMHSNPVLMAQAEEDIHDLLKKWRKYEEKK